MPIESTENYLKTIYNFEQPGQVVPFKVIVSILKVTPGTATTMMQRLAKRGLVHYHARQGVTLTPKGKRQALAVIRRHRILELFLVKIMGFNWSEVHAEAEILEHVISPKLLQRMDELLGFPQTDPHGSPIPSDTGALPEETPYIALSDCAPREKWIFRRVATESVQVLELLDRHQLALGDEIRVTELDKGAGVLGFQNRRKQTVRLSLANASLLQGEKS